MTLPQFSKAYSPQFGKRPLAVLETRVPDDVLREAHEAVELKWIMSEEGWVQVPVVREKAGDGWIETVVGGLRSSAPSRCPVCQRWMPCGVDHPEKDNG